MAYDYGAYAANMTPQQKAIYIDSLAQGNTRVGYNSGDPSAKPPANWDQVQNTIKNASPSSGGSSGSGGSGGSTQPSSKSQSNEVDSRTRALQKSISSGWDNYIRGLDDQLGSLSSSRDAQQGIVNSQYNQGVNDLSLQRDQGFQALDADRQAANQNQVANLRDISSNIRNAFQAGNVYLGARGAGDSSAANQYSFALNKMGTQQRSDVMNNTANILAEVESRETNLRNIFDTETRNLGEQRNQALNQVTMWFADAQRQIKQMQNDGKLNKSRDLDNLSKDLLNNAIARVNQIESETSNRRQQLQQWAIGVSENINQLKSNMQQVAQFDPLYPQAQAIAGAPQVYSAGNIATNYGGGGNSLANNEDRRFNLFGNSFGNA